MSRSINLFSLVPRYQPRLPLTVLAAGMLSVTLVDFAEAQKREDRRSRDRNRSTETAENPQTEQLRVEQRGLIYDEENNRWIYEQPSEPSQGPTFGPRLAPPGTNPPSYSPPTYSPPSYSPPSYNPPGGREPGYNPQRPPSFDWGNSGNWSSYPPSYESGWQPPGLPGRFNPQEHRNLAHSLSSDLDYLRALSWRENLSRDHRELVEIAASNGQRFAQLMMNGAPENQAREQYARFDEAWHPAAQMFAEGEFSNRVTGIVHEINRIDNRFHAELHYDQANVYDEATVARLAGDLTRLTADLANDVRRGYIPALGRDGRLLEQLAREASSFASRVRRDGDYDDVVRSFRRFESVWNELQSEAFRVPEVTFRNWRNGRVLHQTVHDIEKALHLAPERQQPTHYDRLASELQTDAQTILELVRQQGRRSEMYAAWAFYQDTRDLSLSLSAGQGSFHRQAAQTLNSWRDIRGQLDGHQYVQPINRVEQNLRILERVIN